MPQMKQKNPRGSGAGGGGRDFDESVELCQEPNSKNQIAESNSKNQLHFRLLLFGSWDFGFLGWLCPGAASRHSVPQATCRSGTSPATLGSADEGENSPRVGP